ncbi:MAG: hypothetical protein HYY30_07390 [Chloroflexi bacterium]|nr:hypothetical protein [Chloroflexota bacterium]
MKKLWRQIELELRMPGFGTEPRVIVAAILVGLTFAWFNQLGVPLRASHSARVTGDEPFYLLTTVSQIEDRDLDLTNDYELRRYRAYFDHPQELWYQSAPTADGRSLSPHNLGTSLLILPAYALGGLDGVKGFLGALGGITVAFMILLAYRATGDLRASVIAAASLGISAPLFIYSTQIYPETMAATIVAVCIWTLLGQSRDWRSAVLLALGLSGLAWLGSKYVLVGGAIALLGFIRLGTRARVLLLALLVPSAAVYAWFHLVTYGGLTPYVVNQIYQGESTVSLVGKHLEVWNRLYRLIGLWIDGEFGLIRWAPVLLLVFPVLPLLMRRVGPARWVLPVVFGTQLLVAVFLSITMRGWWFPGRMLIAVLPLLVIPLAAYISLARRHLWSIISVATAGLYTLGITLALREAAAAEVVVLAVDPFSLSWAPFRMVTDLFPVYTDYQTRTWLLTAAWLIGLAIIVRMGCGLQADTVWPDIHTPQLRPRPVPRRHKACDYIHIPSVFPSFRRCIRGETGLVGNGEAAQGGDELGELKTRAAAEEAR